MLKVTTETATKKQPSKLIDVRPGELFLRGNDPTNPIRVGVMGADGWYVYLDSPTQRHSQSEFGYLEVSRVVKETEVELIVKLPAGAQ